tara:strand:- start:94 stop:243 length:150 start_codon:yes stop_codon:yes gene_type:complete
MVTEDIFERLFERLHELQEAEMVAQFTNHKAAKGREAEDGEAVIGADAH